MSTLESKVSEKIAEEKRLQAEKERQAKEAARLKAEEEKKKQAQTDAFVPSVYNAVAEFPRLARKYKTQKAKIDAIKRGFLGLGKKTRRIIEVWPMPCGVYLEPGGGFYKYDHYVSGLYGGKTGSVHQRLSRAEAVRFISDALSARFFEENPDATFQSINDYVESVFAEALAKR